MKNREIYEQHVKDGATMKQIIIDDHAPIVSVCKKLFKDEFKANPRELLAMCDAKSSDADAADNAPTKVDGLIGSLASLFKLTVLVGDETLAKKFESHGLKVEAATKMADAPIDVDANTWSMAFGQEPKPKSRKELLAKLIEQCTKQKAEIDRITDEIRTKHAEIVEKECEIQKPHYVKAVDLKVKSQRVSLDKDMEKAKQELKSKKESLEIFENSGLSPQLQA